MSGAPVRAALSSSKGRVLLLATAVAALAASGYAFASTGMSDRNPYAPRVACLPAPRGMFTVRGQVPAGVSTVYLAYADGASLEAKVTGRSYQFLVPSASTEAGLPDRLTYVDGTGRRDAQALSGSSFPPCARPSGPLSGIVPYGQEPLTAVVGGRRYDIEIAPSIRAGEISWCESIRTYNRATGRIDDAGTGTCDAGTAAIGSPTFADQLPQQGLSWVFTAPQVAAVEVPGGQAVLTRPDPRLPYDFRVAVFNLPPPKASHSPFELPGSGLVTAIDASGNPIPATSFAQVPPQEQTRSWLYPHKPVPGSCSIAVNPGSALTAGSGSVVTSIVPDPGVIGHAFLPCVDTDLYAPQSRYTPNPSLQGTLEAAVLLDAQHPGTLPAMLPGMTAVTGHPGIYDRPNADLPTIDTFNQGLTAERVGAAWLVVAGGTGTRQRISALHDLTVGPISPTPASAPPAGPPGALCRIGYRPLPGLQEVSQDAITSPTDKRAADFNRAQQIATAAYQRLQGDERNDPQDHARVRRDQAALALDQLAMQRGIQQDELFPPWCDTATFYYQTWPMQAQILLSSNTCPGTRVPVSCGRLRPPWRRTLARALKPVPSHPGMFTVPAHFDQSASTMEQIGKAWLILGGGANIRQQETVLKDLTATIAPSLTRRLARNIASPNTFCAHLYPTAC